MVGRKEGHVWKGQGVKWIREQKIPILQHSNKVLNLNSKCRSKVFFLLHWGSSVHVWAWLHQLLIRIHVLIWGCMHLQLCFASQALRVHSHLYSLWSGQNTQTQDPISSTYSHFFKAFLLLPLPGLLRVAWFSLGRSMTAYSKWVFLLPSPFINQFFTLAYTPLTLSLPFTTWTSYCLPMPLLLFLSSFPLFC